MSKNVRDGGTKGRAQLLSALSSFLALGDTLDDLRRFRVKWPKFFPRKLYDIAEGQLRHGRDSQDPPTVYRVGVRHVEDRPMHVLAEFRDAVQDLWKYGADHQSLSIMLGLQEDELNEYSDLWNRALFWGNAPKARGGLDWKTGRFHYSPAFGFQAALYLVFRESWRARKCRNCRKPFAAKTPTQRFCDPCAEEATKRRVGRWWKRHGKEWRAKRRKKS
jgi:hypothetical protein